MTLPRIRQISINVTLALATIAQTGVANAVSTGTKVSLDSTTMLSSPSIQSESDAASFVFADRIEGSPEEELVLIGNAEIRRGGTVLKGNKITYTQATDEAKVTGNAHLSRQGASFSGPSMRFHLSSHAGTVNDATYEYSHRGIRGCAKNVHFISGESFTLKDAILTTCKPDDEAWYIDINELNVDEKDQLATGNGGVLHFMDLPVIGVPWMAFPIGTDRRSGFLTPTLDVSKTRGVDFAIPYYFNIAPNYDFTFTPRWMTEHGLMLSGEARFLQPSFNGELLVNHIADDKVTQTNRDAVQFEGNWYHGKWSSTIDYNHVSDDDFIKDFSKNVRDSSVTSLNQEYEVKYTDTYWNASINVKDNQTFIKDRTLYTKPYTIEPQLLLEAYNANWNNFEIATRFEATRFVNASRIQGNRLVLDQSISYPIHNVGWFITPKAGWIGTWYELENLDRSVRHEQSQNKNPHRTLPIFSVDAGLQFERDTSWFGRDSYQTLEPRIFYTYIPYRNQDDIPIFDSSIADLSFATLFKESSFFGYDRISEANQLTTMFSTRQIDKLSGMELFRLSLGQRLYFGDQRVGFPEPSDLDYSDSSDKFLARRIDDGQSDLLASVGARLTKSVAVTANAQYSSSDNRFLKGNAGIVWNPKHLSLIALSYRYNWSEIESDDYYDENIKQLDLAFQWPLTDRLYGLFRYNYSLIRHKTVEMIAGLEYLHNCWTLRLATQRYKTDVDEHETSFFFQIELNGLASLGTSPLEELRKNIKGYQSATYVPDSYGPYDYYE